MASPVFRVEPAVLRDNGRVARIRPWLLNCCLVIFSAVVSLILIEVMFRAVLYYGDAKVLHAFHNLGKEAPLIDPNKEASLRQIIQLSDNPRIIYELIPNMRALFVSRRISINSDGFRGPENHSRPFDKIKRIVGLGDSLMFGWGVSDDEHFLALLAHYLNSSSLDGYRWEIVNTAVPGYNAVMEVETLKVKGLHLRPDLVIMAFVGNDLSLPNFIRKEENYLTLQKSFVLNHLAERLLQSHRDLDDGLIDTPFHTLGNDGEKDPTRVPVRYKEMVGLEAYRAAMRELKALSRQYNFELIVFTTYFPNVVREILRDLDIPLVEAGDMFATYMVKHGIKEYEGSPLTVGKYDPHPSALGHAILADVLYGYLRKSGALDRILERRS